MLSADFHPLNPSSREVALTTVDLNDRTFVVSLGFELTRLTESIRQVGLLSPPLLRCRAEGGWQVVCGFQRLLALEFLGWRRFSAWVLPETASPAACLLASVHDNALTRGFNLAERAEMIIRLLTYWDQETVVREFLPLLNVPPFQKHFQKYRQLAFLEKPFQELAAQNRLSLETAATLSQWAAADRQALLPWLETLPLSYSQQMELVEFLTTISRREGSRPRAILARPEIKAILEPPRLTPPQKLRRLREQLRQWCFPRATAARQAFDRYLETLGLSSQPDLRLLPPPAFEGDTFRLELQFEHPKQLAERLRWLLELTDRDEFQALTRL